MFQGRKVSGPYESYKEASDEADRLQSEEYLEMGDYFYVAKE